ncbi:uncharacterized protein METZ01_LOCUS123185, partial [marine metagenome]
MNRLIIIKSFDTINYECFLKEY